MIQEVTLTRIYRGTQTVKKGTPDEREADKVGIKTVEYGDGTWLSTFRTRGTERWNEGDKVSVEVEKNGQFYNFNPVSKTEQRLRKLEDAVFGGGASENVSAPANPSQTQPATQTTEDINPDDIPF